MKNTVDDSTYQNTHTPPKLDPSDFSAEEIDRLIEKMLKPEGANIILGSTGKGCSSLSGVKS